MKKYALILLTLVVPFYQNTLAKEKRIVKIGLVFDFSSNSEAVEQVVQGINEASKESKMLSFEIHKFDSKDSPSSAEVAMLQAVQSKHALDIIVSELNSSKAFVNGGIAELNKVVMITPTATADKVTKDRKYVFSMSFSDSAQAQRLSELIKDNWPQNEVVAFVDEGELYSNSLFSLFERSYLEKGGVISEKFSFLSDADFDQSLEEFILRHKDKKVFFMPVYSETAARILEKFSVLGLNDKVFVGGDAWEQYSKSFETIIYTSKNGHKFFWTSHKDAKTLHPDLPISQAYAFDIIKFIEKVYQHSCPEVLKRCSSETLASGIRSTKFSGIIGQVVFDGNQYNTKKIAIFAVSDGDLRVLK